MAIKKSPQDEVFEAHWHDPNHVTAKSSIVHATMWSRYSKSSTSVSTDEVAGRNENKSGLSGPKGST
jgi:hypothetical protein